MLYEVVAAQLDLAIQNDLYGIDIAQAYHKAVTGQKRHNMYERPCE